MECWVKVGCTTEERAFPQPLELDIELGLSLQKAATSDDLADTLDYATYAGRLKESLEGREHHLVERVAAIAAQLGLDAGAEEVAVTVKKKALPGVASVGVSVYRRRPGA